VQDFKEWSKPNVDEFVKISKWPEDGKRCRVVWWLMKSFVFRVYTVAYDKRIFLRFSPLRPPLFPKWYLRARVCVSLCYSKWQNRHSSAKYHIVTDTHLSFGVIFLQFQHDVPSDGLREPANQLFTYFHLRCTNCAVRM
jgi:hypothetical protein